MEQPQKFVAGAQVYMAGRFGHMDGWSSKLSRGMVHILQKLFHMEISRLSIELPPPGTSTARIA
jgi:hypothetical protein